MGWITVRRGLQRLDIVTCKGTVKRCGGTVLATVISSEGVSKQSAGAESAEQVGVRGGERAHLKKMK